MPRLLLRSPRGMQSCPAREQRAARSGPLLARGASVQRTYAASERFTWMWSKSRATEELAKEATASASTSRER